MLMVVGTDEHGTPIMVAADKEGVSPRELADRYNAVIVDDLRDLGLSVRPVHAHHHAQPLPRHPGSLPDALRQRLHRRADDARRVLAHHGPHPARPLRRGHLPDLRLRGRARRPVRQLRQPARPGRPDRPALEDRRHDAGVPRDRALLPRPAGVRRRLRRVDRRRRTHWRPNVRNFSLEPARGAASRARSPATSTGASRSRCPATPSATTSASTSGSTRSSATSRPAIEWAHNRGTPDAWRDWWQNPDARHYYFMGKDNIVFHSVIWPAMLIGYGEGGDDGARHGRRCSCPTMSSAASS